MKKNRNVKRSSGTRKKVGMLFRHYMERPLKMIELFVLLSDKVSAHAGGSSNFNNTYNMFVKIYFPENNGMLHVTKLFHL